MVMHSKIPVTATHISICSKEPLRPTKGIYAEVYTGAWWVGCATLRNSDLLGGVDHIPNRAKPIHKEGWRKLLCNFRLFLLRVNYRV